MAKYKVKAQRSRLTVKVKLSYQEKLNESRMSLFLRQYLRGFLKIEIRKKRVIQYSGPAGISLHERLKRTLGKSDFFFMMEQIVDIVQKVNYNKLDINDVVLDLKHVFINEATRELQFVYLPLEAKGQKSDILNFIESIIYSSTTIVGQESRYISEFIYFIRDMQNFDANKVEKYILEKDRNAVYTIKQQNIGQSGFMTKKQGDLYYHYEEKENEETGILEEDEKTGILSEYGEDEATGLLNETVERNQHVATLYRILTDEVIFIDKPVFRIGKEKSCSDYFVESNDKVSRNHADIICKGQRYYIMDLNSKNRTFVNEQIISIQQEVEIFDGDHIRLANEEFEFRL